MNENQVCGICRNNELDIIFNGNIRDVDKNEVIEVETSRTLSLVVDNQPGTLARVIGLFSGRGYNIESLTVTEVDKIRNLSRISLVTRGTSMTIEQIKSQLLKKKYLMA